MSNTIEFGNLMGVNHNHEDILGKLLYFSLSNVLVNRDTLKQLCSNMGLPVSVGNRISPVDSFKRATSSVHKSDITKRSAYKVYFRDNKRTNIVSRELIKETLDESTNRYHKLANIQYDKDLQVVDFNVTDYDLDVDVYALCHEAVDRFELYKDCAGVSQIESMTDSFLEQMESVPISIHGRLYFVPRKHESSVNLFEDFIGALEANNLNGGKLTVNSIYVADDEKQRRKMADEFLSSTRQDILFYTEKLTHFIETDCQSVAIMDRWVSRIHALDEKKRMYEEILQRDLSDLGEDYANLKFLATELNLRSNKISRMKSRNAA